MVYSIDNLEVEIRQIGDEGKTTMATHGTLGEFNSSAEDWMSYAERLQLYFKANDVADSEKQQAVLLSSCGAATYTD